MPSPTDMAGVGIVQYLAKFIPNLSDISDPFRKRLKCDIQELKQLVSSAPVLRFYNVDEPVTISVDANSKGLGVVLLQNKQPVSYGSRDAKAYLPDSNDKLIDDELDISYIEKQLPISSRKIAEIKDATEADENLKKLGSVVVSGWHNSKEMLLDDIQSNLNFRDEITVIDGLLYTSQCICIPKSLQQEMLVKLHEAHLGIVKTKQRAREILLWRNMNSDIENFIKNCSICNKFRKANCKEPLKSHDVPSRPWTKLGADLLEFKGKH
ncbi:Hypothetical predicted protein [Mytilus galloprovincialis]|uniref:Integrase zinc-binding domain-containing protein n=1 Tax=Mytilus galloprovincialis TaxID=29158 RepID=A0A8B6CSJ8_MYTGA|nr:Hypothetical predicted protein [Mytilus galloprovincialis]